MNKQKHDAETIHAPLADYRFDYTRDGGLVSIRRYDLADAPMTPYEYAGDLDGMFGQRPGSFSHDIDVDGDSVIVRTEFSSDDYYHEDLRDGALAHCLYNLFADLAAENPDAAYEVLHDLDGLADTEGR